MPPIERYLLSTLTYFDFLDYPLTLLEIQRYFFIPNPAQSQSNHPHLIELQTALQNLLDSKQIQEKAGFYFLAGREEIIKTRLARYRISFAKYKKALRIAKLLASLPFVQMIGVCNTLSLSNAEEKSDIDLFIITAPKKIWTTRFWINSLLRILRERPKLPKTQNKICTSYFISEERLNLAGVTLKNDGQIDDPHFCLWLSQVVPIYDRGGIYDKLFQANEWLKKFMPNFIPLQINPIRTARLGKFSAIFKKFLEMTQKGEIMEKLFKKIQLRILPSKLKEMMNKNLNVVITDYMLKFHANDTREKIRKEFYEKIT